VITAIRLSALCSAIRQLPSIYKVKEKSSSIRDATTTYKADQESHCTESRKSRSNRQSSCSKMQTYAVLPRLLHFETDSLSFVTRWFGGCGAVPVVPRPKTDISVSYTEISALRTLSPYSDIHPLLLIIIINCIYKAPFHTGAHSALQ